MNRQQVTNPPHPPRPGFFLPGPSFWVALGLLFLLACILAFVPLFDLLGYEFSAAISWLISLTSGPVAIGVARRRPAVWLKETRPAGVVASVYARALLLNLLTLVPPLVVILFNALRIPNCNLAVGFLFFLLLPAATAAITTAWGTVIGLAFRRRFIGGLCYLALWTLVAIYNLWEFWTGPQMDSYNQLLGWVSGPVFEEVVEPGLALLLSRLHGLSWALAMLTITAAFLDTQLNRLRAGVFFRNRNLLIPVGFSSTVALVLFFGDTTLGYGRSNRAVESVLSATVATPHFVIHHHPDLPKEKIRLLAEDHDFRLYQIQKLIGPLILPPIHSYVFPNASDKRRLVGAATTQYAKPWRFSMYLNGAAFPHPTLKHELVHVAAAAFGSWPFRTSARWMLWQNVGLIEGLPVAIDWPVEKFDPHTWSAAQRKIGKAPDIRSLFDPVGFWKEPARRSYVLAGSFVRFLLQGYGVETFRQAYWSGSLEGIYPKPQEQLVGEWEEFLDGLPLAPGVLEASAERFSQRSIFQRACAHEIAALRAEARSLLARDQPEPALRTLERILAHLPNDPEGLELLAQALVKQQKIDQAAEILRKLLESDDLETARKVRISGRLGDLMVLQGRLEDAGTHFENLLSAHLDDGTDRTATVKLQALGQGQSGRKILDFLERGKVDIAAIIDLLEVAGDKPQWGTVWYLLGRQLYSQDLFKRAVAYLERAGREGLSDPALASENLRLLAVAYYHTGHRQRAAAMLSVLAQYPRHQGDLLWALDWLDRIGFDHRTSRGK